MTAAFATGATVIAQATMTGCGLIFLAAGIQKFLHRHVLSGVVANYQILPASLVGLASAMLPPLECLIGIMLLLGIMPISVVAGATLLLVFAAAMATNLLRGRRQINCGCGRPDLRQELSWAYVVRNLVLAGLLLTTTIFAAPLDPMARASALFAGIAIWIAHLLFEAIGAVNTAAIASRRSH